MTLCCAQRERNSHVCCPHISKIKVKSSISPAQLLSTDISAALLAPPPTPAAAWEAEYVDPSLNVYTDGVAQQRPCIDRACVNVDDGSQRRNVTPATAKTARTVYRCKPLADSAADNQQLRGAVARISCFGTILANESLAFETEVKVFPAVKRAGCYRPLNKSWIDINFMFSAAICSRLDVPTIDLLNQKKPEDWSLHWVCGELFWSKFLAVMRTLGLK